MEILESKREENNVLFRCYHSISEDNDRKEYYLNRLIEYNLDLVVYTIKNYFPKLIYHKIILEIGLVGLINAIENYEMDKIGSFEEFIVANIKNEINAYNQQENPIFVISLNDDSRINYGDIWYNRTPDVNQMVTTKENRNGYVKKLLYNVKKNI